MSAANVPSGSLNSYLTETRRPIYSAALVLPFLIVYEVGVVWLDTAYINGADAIIMRLMHKLSLGAIPAFASGVVLIACFVVWQVRSGASWKLDTQKLGYQFLESLAFAAVLFVFLGWISARLPAPRSAPGLVLMASGESGGIRGTLEQMVLYCGAGVYEELLFRVLQLQLLMLVFTKLLKLDKAYAAAWAVGLGAVIFSLFHYIGAEEFHINSFLQRTFAGVYFAAVYVTRSFGVAAAAHAEYDIMVGIAQIVLGRHN
ncbi:MAG: CPBP family intramembrane metalloprotease [Planctomycetes bacterium]|nr:CPBP family intramembrane metalloprotease [Planctomycetota bacterium]